MGQTGHGQINRKLKGVKWNSKLITASKGNNINTDLIEYFSKTLVKKKWEKIQTCSYCFQHYWVFTFVNHNHKIKCTQESYSCEDQDVASDEISYSYDCTTSHTTDSVFFQEIISRIVLKKSTYNLNSP